MAVQFKEKFDQEKLRMLYENIKTHHEMGQPFDYEVLVDGFKAVRRTSNPEMFSLYENFIKPHSRSVEVLFYTGSSNNNDKFIFVFPDDSGLNGVDIDARATEMSLQKDKDKELDQLRKDLKECQEEVEELEEDIEKLEKEKAEILANQSPLKSLLGEVGSSFVESFIRRNPQVIKSLPGGEALAGFIENDNKRKAHEEEQGSQDTAVSFQPKTNNASLSEQDKASISFVNQVKSQFSREEFDQVVLIIQALASEKAKIAEIISLYDLKI